MNSTSKWLLNVLTLIFIFITLFYFQILALLLIFSFVVGAAIIFFFLRKEAEKDDIEFSIDEKNKLYDIATVLILPMLVIIVLIRQVIFDVEEE